jgi:hypothetical protein
MTKLGIRNDKKRTLGRTNEGRFRNKFGMTKLGVRKDKGGVRNDKVGRSEGQMMGDSETSSE